MHSTLDSEISAHTVNHCKNSNVSPVLIYVLINSDSLCEQSLEINR